MSLNFQQRVIMSVWCCQPCNLSTLRRAMNGESDTFTRVEIQQELHKLVTAGHLVKRGNGSGSHYSLSLIGHGRVKAIRKRLADLAGQQKS